jgi:hypothetical protein
LQYVSPGTEVGYSNSASNNSSIGAYNRGALSELSTPSRAPSHAPFRTDTHSHPLYFTDLVDAPSRNGNTRGYGSTPSSAAAVPLPQRRSASPLSSQSALRVPAHAGSIAASKSRVGHGVGHAAASGRASAQGISAAVSFDNRDDHQQQHLESGSWTSELARKIPQDSSVAAASSRQGVLAQCMPTAYQPSSAEISSAHAAQSPRVWADASQTQRANLGSSGAAASGQDRKNGSFDVQESQQIHALKSKLLSYEGNMRIMQSALDEVRRQNIELVQASTQSKSAQVGGVLEQLTATMNQLREMQQQRDNCLLDIRAAEQRVFELEGQLSQIQSEAAAKDSLIRNLTQRCISLEKATENATSKFKAAADECKRLEREKESYQPEAAVIELQTQTARADEATAKLREAEDELQRCRYTMQHDADRLQVMCDGVAVCFCMRAASDLKALS